MPETFAPSWPIETRRLVLRPFVTGDLDALYSIHSDAGVVRYLYDDARTLDEVRELLDAKIRGAVMMREGDRLSAAVIIGETKELIGDISLRWSSEVHRQGELGFIFHPSHHGHGYATEASRPMLAFAFETLGLHRMVGRTDARNAGSARVLEKLGMRREANLVENEWVKGEWQSELVYAMLAREWADQSAPGALAARGRPGRAIVVKPHAASYPYSVEVAAGDPVVVGRQDSETPGWRWCTDATGLGAWVHEAFLDGDRIRRPYSSRELTVAAGDELAITETVGGWCWSEKLDGSSGWVPASCLAVSD